MSNISRNDLVRYMTKHAGLVPFAPLFVERLLGRGVKGLGSAAMRGAGEVAATRSAAAAGKAIGTGERAFGATSIAEGLATQRPVRPPDTSLFAKPGSLGLSNPGVGVSAPNASPGSLIAKARGGMVGTGLPVMTPASLPHEVFLHSANRYL